MERDIINQLVEWKNSSDRKPLLLTGVRQCGKTWVMNTFGQRYFEDVAYFVFEENQLLSSLFGYNLKTYIKNNDKYHYFFILINISIIVR